MKRERNMLFFNCVIGLTFLSVGEVVSMNPENSSGGMEQNSNTTIRIDPTKIVSRDDSAFSNKNDKVQLSEEEEEEDYKDPPRAYSFCVENRQDFWKNSPQPKSTAPLTKKKNLFRTNSRATPMGSNKTRAGVSENNNTGMKIEPKKIVSRSSKE